MLRLSVLCTFHWLWEEAWAAENARDRGNRRPRTHRQLFIRRLAASLFCLNASGAGRLVRVDAAISRRRRYRGVSEVSLRLSPSGLQVVMFWMTRCSERPAALSASKSDAEETQAEDQNTESFVPWPPVQSVSKTLFEQAKSCQTFFQFYFKYLIFEHARHCLI